jgi:hypothetical protein
VRCKHDMLEGTCAICAGPEKEANVVDQGNIDGKEKLCTRCKKVKPLEDFNKSKFGKFGVRADCRVCQAEWFKKHRKEKIASSQPEKKRKRVETAPESRHIRTPVSGTVDIDRLTRAIQIVDLVIVTNMDKGQAEAIAAVYEALQAA